MNAEGWLTTLPLQMEHKKPRVDITAKGGRDCRRVRAYMHDTVHTTCVQINQKRNQICLKVFSALLLISIFMYFKCINQWQMAVFT